MEKVFCQRMASPVFSFFTLIVPVTISPSLGQLKNGTDEKRASLRCLKNTKMRKKTKSFLSFRCPAVICGGRERRGPGPPAAGFPARSPAHPPGPGECVQVAPADESSEEGKKTKTGVGGWALAVKRRGPRRERRGRRSGNPRE